MVIPRSLVGLHPRRPFAIGLGVAMALLVAWCCVVLLVVDPVQTVSRDLGALYGGGSVAVVPVVVVLVGGAGAVAAGLAVTVVARVDELSSAPVVARLVRAATASYALGAVATGLAVLGFPVGLGFYSRAEDLGIAPPVGSMGSAMAVTSGAGLALLVVGASLAVATGTALASLPRPAHRPPVHRAVDHRPEEDAKRPRR